MPNNNLNTDFSEVPISANQLDQILSLQQHILEMVADNFDYMQIIDKLCGMAEGLLPGSVASVMLTDSVSGLLNVLSAPSIPAAGIDALHGLRPGSGGGSCGNAVFRNEPVFVSDTFTDPRWQDLRQVAIDFNLCSCWSMPVSNQTGDAVGSFALSSFEHREPSAFHKRLLEVGASVISIVLHKQGQDTALKENSHRLEILGTALSNSSDGVIITNANNDIIETNQVFEKVTGYSQTDVIGKNPRLLSSGQHQLAFYQQMWKSLNNTGTWIGELINKSKQGPLLHLWTRINRITDNDGKVLNYVAVFSDLSEIKRGEERLIHALEHDQLTGLPNKNKLTTALAQTPHQRTLILLDLNNFSYINMAYGLRIGDQLLQEVADVLREIQPNAHAYRVNADEFALLYDAEIDIKNSIHQIQNHFFSKQIHVGNLGFNITFTYGATSDLEDLFSQALIALKKAKEFGKNRYHIYNPTGDEFEQEQRLEHMRWNGLLHEALNCEALKPYYQGIRDNRTGRISHYEALARIEHEGKIYSPYLFLKPARLSGLLPAIAQRMIDASFADMAANEYSFSINITEEDLNQNYLCDFLQMKSQQYTIAPERVTLEILEGVSAGGKKNHVSQLSALKAHGYKLAIDDFGTEYSNFERILEMEVDYIKIDARYIKNIDQDKTSYEITKAIVYFAKNANIPTIAEFVHSTAVQDIIEELGIEYSQGYLFSEPAPSVG
ncbi:MAG: EAL domain-containing protein [Motiliproteus sp.]